MPSSTHQLPIHPVSTSQTIEIRQRVAAPLEQVWKACASARGLTNWQADDAEGEARRGGTLTLHWNAFGASIQLNVVDLVPYQRLVLRHGSSVVEMHFETELVTLTHHGLGVTDDALGLRSSWQIALAQLAHSVERHPGRQRRVQWLVNRMTASPESAHLCFTDPQLLRRWLTEDGALGATGDAYTLHLKSGRKLSGTVLACVPGRDLALSCREHGEAVLLLRTFPSPASPAERFVAMSLSEWGRPREQTETLVHELASSLQRLGLLLKNSGSA